MTEGRRVRWMKGRKDLVPTESSFFRVFWRSDVSFLRCWFGTSHFRVVAHVGLLFELISVLFLPGGLSGMLYATFCTLCREKNFPAELITTRPHNYSMI